jgi:phage baseplate assembly protein V
VTAVLDCLRFGIVVGQNAAAGTVRVHFDDVDLVSGEMQVAQSGIGESAEYWIPNIGDQVACLYEDDSEQGICLCSIYSDKQKPAKSGVGLRYIKFGNGSVEMASADASVKINAGGGMEITGNVRIIGTLNVTGIVTAAGFVP